MQCPSYSSRYSKIKGNGKGYAMLVQDYTGPEDFRRFRFPDFTRGHINIVRISASSTD
jgi:hypothetical protein